MRKDALEYISAIKKELANQGMHVREGSEMLEPGALVTHEVPDLVVNIADGKLLIIEVKDAKTYGKLPLSTASEFINNKQLAL